MGEVVDENSLDLLVRRGPARSMQARRDQGGNQQQQQQFYEPGHRRHTSLPKTLRSASVLPGAGKPYSG
jgi:hypothetical protein